jgi:hypothetical protein
MSTHICTIDAIEPRAIGFSVLVVVAKTAACLLFPSSFSNWFGPVQQQKQRKMDCGISCPLLCVLREA